MSVPRDFAKAQLMRLAGKPGWPHEIEAIRELVNTLEKRATSEEHAKHCIDSFSFYSERCPTASDIANELFTTGPGQINPHAGCLVCQGSGFVTVQVGDYDGVAPCRARQVPDGVTA
jgi:hypothetical protein